MSNHNMIRMQEEKQEELDIFEQAEVDKMVIEQNDFMNDNIVYDACEASISGLIPAGILTHDDLAEIITDNDFIQLMITSQHNLSEFVARYRFRKLINKDAA